MEKQYDLQNRYELQNSIKRIAMVENDLKLRNKDINRKMHENNLQNQRNLKMQQKIQQQREKQQYRQRWKRNQQIQQGAHVAHQNFKDQIRNDLQQNYNNQAHNRENQKIQEKIADIHHAEAYNARINELDHISYRKYKKRLEGLITPSPIKSLNFEQKQRLRQAMQKQGIYGNEKRHQREFQTKNKRQQQAIQANNYNKEKAVLKMKELERIKRSPRQEQFKRVLLAKEQSRQQFLNRGQNQSFSHSNNNSKLDLQNPSSKQFSLQRDYRTNPHSPGLPSLNGSEIKVNNIVGLPQRSKDNLKDQIYNYDSVYNVFGRHYTKRYAKNSQGSQKLSITSDNPFDQNMIASKQRLVNKTPMPDDLRKQPFSNLIGENPEPQPHRAVSISPARFNRQIQRDSNNEGNNIKFDSNSRNIMINQQKSVDRMKSKQQQKNNSMLIEQSNYGLNDNKNELPPLSQHGKQILLKNITHPSLANINEVQHINGHKRSQTIDQSVPKPYSNISHANNNFFGAIQGGGSLNNEMDAKVRNYLRIQDNLRSMRTNKQLMNEYSIDRRGKDDTLAHYGQFMIKNN